MTVWNSTKVRDDTPTNCARALQSFPLSLFRKIPLLVKYVVVSRQRSEEPLEKNTRVYKGAFFGHLLTYFLIMLAFASNAFAANVTSVSSSTPNGSYKAGQVINVQVLFNQAVYVTTTGGTPTLTLETGSSDAVVNYSSGSGTSTLVFAYTIAAGHTSADLNYVATSSLALNSGTIKDASNNNATLTLPGLASGSSLAGGRNLKVDTTVPTVTITSSATSSTNTSPIPITITFSESVTGFVSGDLTIGNGTITSFSGSGASYTASITPTSNGAVTVDIAAGAATDTATNGNTIATQLTRTYDNTSPTVTSVTSTTSNATYKLSQTINIRVNMSESVTVTVTGGTPKITLETGSSDAVVNYSGLTGTPVSYLDFTYTIAAGHT